MNDLQLKKRAFMSIVNSTPVGFERETEADGVITLDTFKSDNLIDLKLYGKTVEIAPTDAEGNIIEKSPETPWEFSSIENPTITISGRNLLDKDTMCATSNSTKKFTITDTGFRQELIGTTGYTPLTVYDITNIVKPNTTYYFHRELEKNFVCSNNTTEQVSGYIRYLVDGTVLKTQYNSYGNHFTFTTPAAFTSVSIATYTVANSHAIQDYDPSITYYLEWKNVYLSEVPYEEYVPYEGESQTVEVPYTLRGLYVIPSKEDTYRTYTNDNNEAYISDAIEMRDGRVYYTQRIDEVVAGSKLTSSVYTVQGFYNTYERYVFYTILATGQVHTGYNNGNYYGYGRTILCNIIKSWNRTYNETYNNDYGICTGGGAGNYLGIVFFSIPKSHFSDLINPTKDELIPYCQDYLNSLEKQGIMKFVFVRRTPASDQSYPVWTETDITDTELGQALLKVKTYKYGTVISTNGHLSAKYYSNIKGVEE